MNLLNMFKIMLDKIRSLTVNLKDRILENCFKIYNHHLKKFWNMFTRVVKNYFHKLIYTTVLLLFTYQFYDITHQYFRYQHSINFVISKIPSVVPSITQCVYQKHSISNIKNGSIECRFLLTYSNGSEIFFDCDEISDTIYVRYRKNSICVTFLNNISERDIQNYLTKFEKYRLFPAVLGYKRSQLIIHDHFTPSHFITKNVFQMTNKFILRLTIKKIYIQYLPYPYSTNCRYYDYEKGLENSRNIYHVKDFLTKPGCMLILIIQKYKEYHCDYHYWKEYVVENGSEINWNKFVDLKCDYKINFKQIQRKCKIECQHIDYLVTTKKIIKKENMEGTIGMNSHNSVYMINMTYIANMDFVNYLSTLGGLMSMYYGLSVYSIFNIVMEFIKKITYFFK